MRALEIAIKDVKTIIRDRKALVMIIAMPLILILILGTALSGMFSPLESMSSFSVAVVDLDKGETAQHFLEVMSSDELKELIEVRSVDTEEAAKQLVDNKEVAAAIVLPASLTLVEGDYSEELAQKQRSIRVIGDAGEMLKVSIVKGIVGTFSKQYSLAYAGTSTIMEALLTRMVATYSYDVASQSSQGTEHTNVGTLQGMLEERGVDPTKLGNDIAASLLSSTMGARDVFVQRHESQNWITALQYYAAGMVMMFVLFGAMFGVQTITEERDNRTLMRLYSTQATKAEIIVGKTLGTLVICILQVMVMILFTKYVYKVDWGNSLVGVVLLSVTIAFAATSFIMFLGSLTRSRKAADGLKSVGVQVMSFLGGCTFPIYVFPKVLRVVSKGTVTWWGLKGYLDLMLGHGVVEIMQPIAILALMGIAYLSLGIWRLRLE